MIATVILTTLALVFFFGVFPHMLMVVVVGVLRIQTDADVGPQAGSREMRRKGCPKGPAVP